MPTIGWVVEGQEYTYEEAERIAYETGFFKDFPPAALVAMKQTREDKHWLSPSSAGGCPRQRVLRTLYDYYQELEGSWSPGMGTAIHGWLADGPKSSKDTFVKENWLSTDLVVDLRDGTQTTFKLQGTADYYDIEQERGYDYKTVSEFTYWHNGKRQRVERDLPTEAHIIQANLYKYLLEANGMKVKEYYLWYVRTSKEAERKVVPVELWENEEIYHIAADLAEPLAWYEKTGELPNNKYDSKATVCRYCPLKAQCRALTKEGK